MATGSLALTLTDTLGDPIRDEVDIDFHTTPESAGGARMDVTFKLTSQTDVVVTNVECLDGPGTRYEVWLSTNKLRSYGFFQLMLANRENPATDSPVPMVVKPKRVVDIDAPAFASLDVELATFLSAAEMQTGEKKLRDEDKELLGKTGKALYDALGPLRKACLLNLFTKANHVSTDHVWHAFFIAPLILRQDRCFCGVKDGILSALQGSPQFKTAPDTLHKPLDGYKLVDSFKSRDPHANLQVTLMRHEDDGSMAADVDIDESSGFEHGVEVIKNAVSGGRTNPYLVRELLLLSDQTERSLDPGYRFVF